MEHCINDIAWLQNLILSMEGKYIDKGRISVFGTEDGKGNEAITLNIDNTTENFTSPIAAANYIVKYLFEEQKRKKSTHSVMAGAIIGGTVAYASKTDVLLGISIGSITAFLYNHLIKKIG